MNTLRTPVVVVGIGDKQPAVLRFALSQAQRMGAELRVVHSAGLPVQAAALYVGEEMYEDLRRQGQTVLEAAEQFIMQEAFAVSVKYVLTPVAPVEALETEAAKASLLVIGVDAILWPERLLGGAIATHVARHARCPVLVVPESGNVTPPDGGVTLALEGDSAAVGPLRFAFEEASRGGGSLHILHAMPPATLAGDVEAMRANVAEVLAGWSGQYPDVRLLLDFPLDDAEDACVQATEHSELVVVGRSHSHLPFGLGRPLATRVLKRAHCPVAVVPADYQGA